MKNLNPFTSIQQSDFIDKMHFASCKSHVDVGTVSVFTRISGTVSVFTRTFSLWSSVFDARTSVSIVETDSVWCALFRGCGCALLGGCWLLSMSVCANVDGARVLTMMDVPRAVSGQLGSGSGVAQHFKSSMWTYNIRASAST